MNKRILNISAALLVLLAAGGCSTTTVEQLGYGYDKPILSAADATSMISVEVRELEPIMVDDSVVAAANPAPEKGLAE